MICPPFNLVFEETPHEFLYEERKTSLGEGCLSERTDLSEWVRERRPITNESMWFWLWYFANCLPSSWSCACTICSSSVLYVSRLFSGSPFQCPPPSLLPPSSRPLLTSVHLRIALFSHTALPPPPPLPSPILTVDMSVYDHSGFCLCPVHITIGAPACVCPCLLDGCSLLWLAEVSLHSSHM